MSSYHLPVNIAQTKLSYNIWRLYWENTSFFGTGKVTAFPKASRPTFHRFLIGLQV